MVFKSFIVPKIDKIKNVQLEQEGFCSIDINSWFKCNNLTPSIMNEVRQYIFEEWLCKKISGYKNKVCLGYPLVIIYDNSNEIFVSLLKEKLLEIFPDQISDIILID